MPWDPMKGERLAPAWSAAVRLLKDGEWHPWDEVVQAMLDASDLQKKTCAGVLYGAIRNGHVHKLGKYDQKSKKDTRVLGWGYKG